MSWSPEDIVRRFDDFQQDRVWLALPVGTIRKYADDRGSAFANIVTIQIFLGLLPLLVVALTIFERVIGDSEELAEAVLDSTLAQFPVIGAQLEEDLSAISASGPWLAVAIAGLFWTASGIYHGLQLAMNQVWNVEGVHRQGFVSRHVRALLLFVIVMGAAIGTAFIPRERFDRWAPPALDVLVSASFGVAVSFALLFAALRIVVSPSVPTLVLVPAAVLSALFWTLLQDVGSWIVVEQLAGATDIYGSIGLVLVMLMWINLLARSVVFANEWAAVSWRQLWPRRIAQPPLTSADRQVLRGLALNERRRPEEHITVTFDEEGSDEEISGAEGV
jgi:YihY family inner membrane protein